MRILFATLAVALWIMPVQAQMSTWQGSHGVTGQSMDLGGGMGQWSDSKGNTGTYQSFGNQGVYQDSKGTQGMWMDNGPTMRQFHDNKGGQGQTQDLGGGLGAYQYQRNWQGQQGGYQRYGR